MLLYIIKKKLQHFDNKKKQFEIKTVESAGCAFLRVAFMSSDFIDPIIYLFNLLIKIEFISLDKNSS